MVSKIILLFILAIMGFIFAGLLGFFTWHIICFIDKLSDKEDLPTKDDWKKYT